MPAVNSTEFLRRMLLIDAAISGSTGVLLAVGADTLERLLSVPAAVLRPAGVSLLPFAALLVALATRPALPRAAVMAVIGANALWVVASVLLLVSGLVTPTVLGYTFVIVQAIAVLGFAELQWMGLKRAAY
jgi:hypothetical protein